MKRFKVRLISATVVAIMTITGLAGCSLATLDGTQKVMTISEVEVPLGVASFALRYSQAQTDMYYKQFAAMGLGVTVPKWEDVAEGETKTNGERTKDDVMNRLQRLYEVKAHADDYGVSLDTAEMDKIAAAAQEFIASNDSALLSRMGVDEKSIVEYLELETYFKKAFEPMVETKGITVSDEEAKQSTVTYTFLSTNNLEAEAAEEAKAQIEGLLAEYKEQEDIANFDMNEFTTEKDAGYMTTTTSFGDDEEAGTGLDDAVKEAARTLQDGEMYQEIIEGASGGGYFIVRMDKVNDPEATATKKDTIEREKKQEAFNEMSENWVEEATITIDEKVWGKVKLTDKEAYVIKVEETTEVELAE